METDLTPGTHVGGGKQLQSQGHYLDPVWAHWWAESLSKIC